LAPLAAVLASSGSLAAYDPAVPATIPKYQSQLLIPLEMPPSTQQPCTALGAGCPSAKYNIATRPFKMQVLPAVAGTTPLLTPVWGYGRAEDPLNPSASGAQQPGAVSSFSYPAFTIENTAGNATAVRWINELVSIDPGTARPYASGDARRTFAPSLFPIDPTLHWANPMQAPCAATGLPGTDCRPDPAKLPLKLDAAGNSVTLPYTGAIPMVVHVHGADVNAQSDGYAESWWLPDASNLAGYAQRGQRYDQFFASNTMPGSQAASYENTQPATTLWYHDHTIGISRNTVYAGQAGFWLIRGNYTDPQNKALVASDTGANVLPGSAAVTGRPTHPSLSYGGVKGCDANADAACRAVIREIPLLLQDRNFNSDGSFYYPASRDEANTYAASWNPATQAVPYEPASPTANLSDVAPIINPENFGAAMLVNGRTWPTLTVAAEAYRFRLLAGGGARTFNLSLWTIPAALIAQYGSAANVPNAAIMKAGGGNELPIYVIGGDQGFLPHPVKVMSGHIQAPVLGDGTVPSATCLKTGQTLTTTGRNKVVTTQTGPTFAEDPQCERALLIAPGERRDVVVDFTNKNKMVMRLINTGPDVPFNGFPLDSANGPTVGTTDQLMQFVVNDSAMKNGGVSKEILNVKSLPTEAVMSALGAPVRQVALVENESAKVCASLDLIGNITDAGLCSNAPVAAVKFGPAETMLGRVVNGMPVAQAWSDSITQEMVQGQVELWELYNFTQDAHPMHLHDTRFQVVSRQALQPDAGNPLVAAQPLQLLGKARAAEPVESGYKDVVVANPREVTRVLARFNRSGVYVWHCHILEHEDNEMMLPMCVRPIGVALGNGGFCSISDGSNPAQSSPLSVPVARP
jgi:FtsP/CotA-like multicopper oxidase with cupredoxin domain